MGQQLVAQMLPVLSRVQFSEVHEVTGAGARVFAVGRDTLDTYQGDPRVLGDALRIFKTANSRPYEYAGIACTLLAASAESDGRYSQEGLSAAMEWLEKAQELAPDITSINVIEALIYTYSGRMGDARIVLDYLHEQDPQNYYLHRAEIAFWRAQGNPEEAIKWCARTIEVAENVPQRLRLRAVIADLYLEMDETEKALETYREALYFNPDSAYLHHRMALVHYRRGEYDEALTANEKALSLEPELAEARRLQATLRDAHGRSSGLIGRLFGS